MRHQAVPDHRLKGLRMRSHVAGGNGRHNDRCIGYLSRMAAIATDDTEDLESTLPRLIQGMNKVHGDVAFGVSAADGEKSRVPAPVG